MPQGISIPNAIDPSLGVQNFVQTYMAVGAHQQQMKLQALEPLTKPLYDILSDNNKTFDEKADAMDTIQHIYSGAIPGLKNVQPISQVMRQHLGDLAKQGIGEQGQDVSQGQTQDWNNVSNLSNDASNPSGASATPGLDSQLDSQSTTGTPVNVVRRGSLSPNDIAAQRQMELNTVSQRNELDRQAAVARIQADLIEQSYKAQGYTMTGVPAMDTKTGEMVLTFANRAGDVKTERIPGVTAISTINKQVQAGAVKGILGQWRSAEEDLQNPDIPEGSPRKIAAGEFIKDKKNQRDYYSALTERTNLGNTGQTPQNQNQIQTAQRDIAKEVADRTGKHNDLVGNAKAQSNYVQMRTPEVQMIEKMSGDAQKTLQAAQSAFEAVKDNGKGDVDYDNAKAALDKADTDYKVKNAAALKARNDYDEAVKKDNEYKGKVDESQKNLDKFINENPVPGVSSNNKSPTFSYGPAAQKQITVFKQKNAAKLQTTPMSDEQIYQYLIGKGLINTAVVVK